MFASVTHEKFDSLVGKFLGKKPEFSNFYGISPESLGVLETDSTLLLRKKERDFYRLYVLSSDAADLKAGLSFLKDADYVINIPSKAGLGQWGGVLSETEFKPIGVYERMNCLKLDKSGNAFPVFADADDFSAIRRLVDETFSKYTDYPPTDAELEKMISEKRVLATKRNFEVMGALAFTPMGQKCYMNFWVDKVGGPKLLFDMYNLVAEMGFRSVYLWVNSENLKVKKMHEYFGAKADGLKDYSFLKKMAANQG